MGHHSDIIPAAPPPASRRRRPETLPKGGHKTFLQSILERHGNDGDDAADVLWVWNKWCWKIYLQVGRLHSLVTFLIGSQRRTTKDMKSTPNSHRRHCRFGVHLYDNILTCVPLDGSELGSECCDPRSTWWCWCSRKFPISERDNSTLVSSKFNYNSSSSAKIHLPHIYYSRMSVVLDDWLPLNYMGATTCTQSHPHEHGIFCHPSMQETRTRRLLLQSTAPPLDRSIGIADGSAVWDLLVCKLKFAVWWAWLQHAIE